MCTGGVRGDTPNKFFLVISLHIFLGRAKSGGFCFFGDEPIFGDGPRPSIWGLLFIDVTETGKHAQKRAGEDL